MLKYFCRLEVQADVTSTQRFSLCSETASAATSLSEKSVNASIALDDGAASTRALAGSVLNFKVRRHFESLADHLSRINYLDVVRSSLHTFAECMTLYNRYFHNAGF